MSLKAFIVIALIVYFGVMVIAAYIESKLWNKGKCKCGKVWRHFDNDSQGGRGYCCDNCKTYIWISYPGIDRKPTVRGAE